MEQVPGSVGTSASLALRFGQIVFSSASLLFMCLRFQLYSYTSFCYLVTVMGLLIPWSTTMAIVDAYSVFLKPLPYPRKTMLIIVIGDWVLSFLTLAAASSTASVTDMLLDVGPPLCSAKLCSRYQLSAATAFLSWFLSFASFLFNFWLLFSL